MVSMLYLVPFYQWAVDIVGDLPRTPGGKMYTIVVVDYFTKWVDAKPLTRQGQDQVYQFFKEIFSRFGVPRVLVTTGKIEDLCLELDIEHRDGFRVISPGQWPCRSDESSNLQRRQETAPGGRRLLGIGPCNCVMGLRLNLDLLEENRDTAVDKMAWYKRKVAAHYNKRFRAIQFLMGDLVLRARQASAHGKPE
ncbi:hypothetical protein LIER_20217 [Lithospermum erythrorhizon]|uniref:Integrase catalytic domain-containing protein n=1 Tax=Lithospermum erythrorhizon TaxID=34254 RepID=A0AAV3QM61_LITER